MLAVIDNVLDWRQVKALREVLATAEFVDGQTTAGARAKRVKHNQQVSATAPMRKEFDAMVTDALYRSAEFQRVALPRLIKRPLFSRYGAGMDYGMHVDDALMGREQKTRSDVSVTIFLSSPEDYEGGELEMNSPYGRQEVKLPAGAAVAYPSSTLHRVKPVTAGERIAAVTWVQSYVRDPTRREVLYDLDKVRRRLSQLDPDGEEADLAFKTVSNLLRMWSDL